MLLECFDTDGEWGIGHMMENLAFKTSKHYTTDDINEISERKGMSMGCTITRDAATYRVDTLRGAVGDALHLLGDTILYPEFHDDDVSEAKVCMPYLLGFLILSSLFSPFCVTHSK